LLNCVKISPQVNIFADKAVILTFYTLIIKMRLSLPSYRAFIGVVLLAAVAIAGCNKSSDDNNTLIPVALTSTVVDSVTTTTAQVAGNITNFVSGTVSAYGICWSATNKTPSLADSKTSLTVANTIRFASNMTGLTPNTLYYVRTYATSTSPAGTYYGNVIQFTTPTATFSIAAATSTYAGLSAGGYAEGAKASALFSSPQGVVADAAGNLYVADSFNNAIRKISTTGIVTTLAGGATAGFTNGTGAAASFYSPQYIAIDASGNLYVTDIGNNAIRKVTPAGVVTTLAGGNNASYDNGAGTSTLVRFLPTGLAVDAAGNVYVAEKSNNLIRKITPAGAVSTLAGTGVRGIGDAVGILAYFSSPTGIAVDAQGIVYVADTGNNAIRQITADGTVTTYIGNPTAQPNLLNAPVAMAFDKTGNLFITDQSGRIMEVTTSKVLYSIAGNINTAGYTEGTGTAAQFNKPSGLTTDASGNIYVADYNNNVIRKLTVTVKP
jgi:streptogramin lyase